MVAMLQHDPNYDHLLQSDLGEMLQQLSAIHASLQRFTSSKMADELISRNPRLLSMASEDLCDCLLEYERRCKRRHGRMLPHERAEYIMRQVQKTMQAYGGL